MPGQYPQYKYPLLDDRNKSCWTTLGFHPRPERLKSRVAVILTALATNPVALYYVGKFDELTSDEVVAEAVAFILIPIIFWWPIMLFYLYVMPSRLSTVLGGCVILIGFPTTIGLVAPDESSTAALGYFTLPYGIILPGLFFMRSVDAFVKWIASKRAT